MRTLNSNDIHFCGYRKYKNEPLIKDKICGTNLLTADESLRGRALEVADCDVCCQFYVMEGVLWKWTNYWNGWQTRWFILDNGVLAYYKSQEEVNQGCKGSMKVTACEIIVNPVDSTRMDLVIPGEQHIYLRAATSQERQQWLVALGSAKACVTTRNRKDSDSNPDTLKSKKSELRLYCDLLMQQVHMVKTAVTEEGGPQVQKLDEATSLLGATCDTFIRTLEDCMKISNANFTYELPHQHMTDIALPPVSSQSKGKGMKPTMPIMRTNSGDKKT